MTALDIEMIVVSMARDAKLIGCAERHQLTPHLKDLIEAQDEIARAIEKAKRMQVAA